MCDSTTLLQIEGKETRIDSCIAPMVEALNTACIPTIACCCGHGKRPGRIVLASGVELEVHGFSVERAYQRWSDLVTVRDIQTMGV